MVVLLEALAVALVLVEAVALVGCARVVECFVCRARNNDLGLDNKGSDNGLGDCGCGRG